MSRSTILACTLLCLSACAAPGERAAPPPLTVTASLESVAEYLAYQQRLREDISDGVIGNLTDAERDGIYANQQILVSRLSGIESIDQLTEQDRIAVLNAQEAINATLVGNSENTPICRRESILGSHRQHVVCLTRKQREQASEAARRSLIMLNQFGLSLDPDK